MSEEVFEHLKRFEADCNPSGEWFVFDNEACYCMAGPMSEEAACDLAAENNAKQE